MQSLEAAHFQISFPISHSKQSSSTHSVYGLNRVAKLYLTKYLKQEIRVTSHNVSLWCQKTANSAADQMINTGAEIPLDKKKKHKPFLLPKVLLSKAWFMHEFQQYKERVYNSDPLYVLRPLQPNRGF